MDQTAESLYRDEYSERLYAVSVVAASAAGSPELEQVLADALDRTMAVFGIDRGLVFLTDRHTGELALRAHRGVSEKAAGELRCVRDADGPLYGALQSGGPSVVRAAWLSPRALRTAGIATAIMAPLRSKGSGQGVLVLGGAEEWEPRPDDLDFVTAIANQVGVAVDNARLQSDAFLKLEVQMHLNELAERILSEFELDAIARTVLDSAVELTGADAGGIALGDGEGGWGLCTFTPPSDSRSAPVQVERVVDREVTLTHRPVIIEDYAAHPGAVRALVRAGLTSLAAVPIAYGDQVFGTLTLYHFDASKRFVEPDVAVALEVGRQTGIAIQNARLHQNMHYYVRQVTRAQEDERKRIARELHDETIQSLVVISRRLEGLSGRPSPLPATAQGSITILQELLAEAIRGVRRFVQDLRPPVLDHLGLVASVEALASDLRDDDGIDASVMVTGVPRRLGPEEELVLFRIAQEALVNTRRHSGATRVEVRMDFTSDRVRLAVSDNGCGFSVPGGIDWFVSQQKLGLIGMSERARTLGGSLDIHSEPGRGATVTVEIPSHEPLPMETPQPPVADEPVRSPD
jgi:two-component system sensor histidine kinase DegS